MYISCNRSFSIFSQFSHFRRSNVGCQRRTICYIFVLVFCIGRQYNVSIFIYFRCGLSYGFSNILIFAIFAIFASRRVGVCVTARSSVRRIVSSRVSARARRRSIDRVRIKIDSTTILDPTNSSPSRARVDANRREPRASLDASKYVSLDAARTRVESSRDASRVDDCVRTR